MRRVAREEHDESELAPAIYSTEGGTSHDRWPTTFQQAVASDESASQKFLARKPGDGRLITGRVRWRQVDAGANVRVIGDNSDDGKRWNCRDTPTVLGAHCDGNGRDRCARRGHS